MKSQRFRVRGYDVFLVQGRGNEGKRYSAELSKDVTCDVTFSLVCSASSLLSCPNTAHSPQLLFLNLLQFFLFFYLFVLPKPQHIMQTSTYIFVLFPNGRKSSWCFSLQPQQLSKVKSPKRIRLPAALPITTCRASPWKRDCVQA